MSFITVENGEFIKDGEPFRFNGTNAYYLKVYQSPLITPNTVVDYAFNTFKESGIKVIRMWAMYDGYDFAYSREDPDEPVIQTSPMTYDENALKYMDQIIAKGKEEGYVFILSLLNYWRELGGISQYNHWAGLTSASELDLSINGEAMHAFINNEDTQGWYEEYISMLLNRTNSETGITYKDEPAIMAWEICNEARNPGANDNGEELRDWYQKIAQHIKAIDTNHLVSTGEEGFDEGIPDEYSRNEYSNTYALRADQGTSYLLNLAIPEIDFGRAHWYPNAFGFGIPDGINDDTWYEQTIRAQDAWIKDHNNIAKNLNKPFCMLEWGLDYWRDYTDQDVKNRLYIPFYRTIENEGVSGSCLWQLLGDGVQQGHFAGAIVYPVPGTGAGGRVDADLFHEFQQHSFNMSQTPEQDPPNIIDSSITVESIHANRFTVSVNAAEGNSELMYKLYYSTQNNLGTTPEDVENNGVLADQGANKLILTADQLEPATQYWYTVLVENTAGDQAIYDVDDLTTLQADTESPDVIVNSLSTSSITAHGFTANFEKATDNATPTEELVYRLYVSTTNPLDGNISSIESEGHLKNEGKDVEQLRADGLFHSTEYFFNIIVEDLSGNKSSYSANRVTTAKIEGVDRNHPMAQQLIAYYQFNEGAGNTIQDISNTDTVHDAVSRQDGGAWNTIDGQIVWSKRENKIEWLEIQDHNDFNFGTNTPFSIGLVCAFGEDNNQWSYLLFKGHWPGYNIAYAGWDDLVRIVIGSITHEEIIDTGIKNDLNHLHSIVLVVKAADNEADLYIDGIFKANLNLSNQKSTTTSDNPIRIPNLSTPENSQMHYNKFAVWRRALSAQEVAAWHENKDLMLTGISDITHPEVPDSTLVADNVTANSFRVNFEKAIDNETPQNELVYRLYTSTSNTISTASEARSNGVLHDERTDVNSLNASGLIMETKYWFNVVVEDQAGNRSAYSVNSITTVSEHGGIDTSHPMAQNLVAYYKFDQGGGSLVEDISNSANRHDAQAKEGGGWNTIGGETVWSKRDGENEWLEISDHSDLEFGTDSAFTIGLICAFAESNLNWNFLLSKGHHPGYNLSYAGWDDILKFVIGSVTHEVNIGSGVRNDLNNLHSIVISVTGVNTEADLYIDGSFVANLDLSAQSSSTNSDKLLRLPHNTTPVSAQMHYNRFAVWGRALSAQEVSDWHENKNLMMVGAGDTTAPEVSVGTLAATNVTDKAFTVNFEKAVDNATPQKDLVYRLYTSVSDNISTAADAESNGTLQDTQTDTDFLNASGLTHETQYWFNVIVEDLSGNKTAYTASSVTTITLEGIDTTHPMAQDLVAYYQFDQGEGVVLHDISNSSNAHDARLRGGSWGSLNGDMVWGKNNGEKAWLEIPDHNDFDFGIGSAFTLGLVCAFGEDNDIWNFLLSKGHHPGYNISYAGWADLLKVAVGDMSKTIHIDSGIKNNFEHLHSVVLAVTAANDKANLYIDGALVDTVSLVCQDSSATSDSLLKAPYKNPPKSSRVQYNKLAVWGRVLSAQEVSDWHEDKDLMLLEPQPSYFTIADNDQLRINGNSESFFPLSMAPSDFWTKVREDGGDIRVTLADGTTQVARAISDFDKNEQRGKLYFDSSAAQANTSTSWRIYYGSDQSEPAFDSEFGRNNAHPNHIASWKLDSLKDFSGNGHSLTGVGNPTLAAGKLERSFTFNGIDQHLQTAHHENLNITPPFTISFWLKPTSVIGTTSIINKHGGEVFTARLDDDIVVFGANRHYISANTAIQNDEWTLVHLTFTAPNTVRDIYLNGGLDRSVQYTGYPDENIDPVYIGARDGDRHYFEGQIEELNIIKKVRSADWIEEEYNLQNNPGVFWIVGS